MGTGRGSHAFTIVQRRVWWTVAAAAVLAMLTVLVYLAVQMRTADTPDGTLPDGTAWGDGLGAVVGNVQLPAGGSPRGLISGNADATVVTWGSASVFAIDPEQMSLTSAGSHDEYPDDFALTPDGGVLVEANFFYLQTYVLDADGSNYAQATSVEIGYGSWGGTPRVGHDDATRGLLASADARVAYIEGQEANWAVDSATGAVLGAIAPLEGFPPAMLAVLGDGSVLLSTRGSDTGSTSAVLTRWDSTFGYVVAEQTIEREHCWSPVAVSPDGSVLACSSEQGVELIDLDTLTIEKTLDQTLVLGVAFDPSGEYLYLSTGREVHLVEISSGQELASVAAAGDEIWAGVGGHRVALRGDHGIAFVDFSAVSTPRLAFLGLAFALLILVVGAAAAAMTAKRWAPLVASRLEKRRAVAATQRQETAQKLGDAAEARHEAKAQRDAEGHARLDAQRAAQIADWERAYALAHGGQAPTQGAAPVFVTTPSMNGLSVAAFVVSLVVPGGLVAIVLGHVALVQIRQRGDRGRGLAIAALVLGYLALVATAVILIVALTS